MAGAIRLNSKDLRDLAAQLNALADTLQAHPYRHTGGLSGCGSTLVTQAGDGANDHFALRALLMETELRDAASVTSGVAEAMEIAEQHMTAGASGAV